MEELKIEIMVYHGNVSIKALLDILPIKFSSSGPYPKNQKTTENQLSSSPAQTGNENFGISFSSYSSHYKAETNQISKINCAFQKFLKPEYSLLYIN